MRDSCWIYVGFIFNSWLLIVFMEKIINWDDISFIVRGKHRKTILKLLDNPKTPTQIKNETKLHFNTVSRTLVELEKKGVVKCLTPKQKLSRFYQITNKGMKLLGNLTKVQKDFS